MKTTQFFSAFLLTAFAVMTFTSCDPTEDDFETPEVSTGLFVLNQGRYGSNNAGLTYYDFETGEATNDFFLGKNDRGLGDTGQDMIRYGSKIYIAMYNSSLVEVINAETGVSVKSIPMKTAADASEMPRSLTAANGNVYVVLYNGYVAQLDTASLTVQNKVKVGPNPEGSAIVGGKLYVANSGGMQSVKDSTLSVINLSTFEVVETIVVNLNPGAVKADAYGDVYVLSNGNYWDIPGKFQRVNTVSKEVTDIDLAAKYIDIVGDKAYIANFEYDSSWKAVDKTIAIYDVKNDVVVSENIVPEDLAIEKTPYSIGVDPTSNDIYVGVTDYVNNGMMYRFDKDGALKATFTTGVNPAKVVFVTK